MAEAYDVLLKLVLVGQAQCGKSCLMARYVQDRYQGDQYVSTIGVEFATKTIETCGKHVKLQIWDTAGQDRFKSITKAYYRGARGVMLLCDVTNEQSFASLQEKLQEIKDMNENCTIVVVATKCDLDEERQVTEQQLQKFALENDLDLMYVSAKTNSNVTEAFEMLTKKILDEIANKEAADLVVH